MKRTQVAGLLVVLVSILAASQSSVPKPFEMMKSLIGDWQGKDSEGGFVYVSYKMTAGGSAIMSEIRSEMQGHREDMISMINRDGARVLLTHYCSAGNQPRMAASVSPDGKVITFSFVDATNLARPTDGHMDHVVFDFIDANHHTEEWHFKVQRQEMVEKFDLKKG